MDELATFAAAYPFGLDTFQREACAAMLAGENVLVAAPTGAGKTVVGEFACHLALAEGRKCFYTTPIKALSNQKYLDLAGRHGAENVGLLTGDVTVNGSAPVVVMTTEVLRNMLYAGSNALVNLGYVVMDEVHYLADRYRGAVWEEVIIHLPESVALISLSATVSNAEEFGDWLGEVRGTTRVVVEEHRPVPLFQHVMAGKQLYDLYASHATELVLEESPTPRPVPAGDVNPRLLEIAREDDQVQRWREHRNRRGGQDRPRSRARTPDRAEIVERLDAEGLLPAIVFVFSRAGCDAAVDRCRYAGLRLVAQEDRATVREVAERHTRQLAEDDLKVLGYGAWLDSLERGIAAHHAGLLPAMKEAVEELAVRGLVKVVFATETLALGVNFPARSVVISSLSKWNGETHSDITAGEYTQLTGRAGRRGIDVEGHAVVLWQPGLDPRAVAGLAGTRTYPLTSSFRPSYNMAVNLVGSLGRAKAQELLASSFAQFQADRSVAGLSKQVQRNGEALAGYREALYCEHGDAAEYDGLRKAIAERERTLSREGATWRRAAALEALEALRPGDVIHIPGGRRGAVAVIIDPGAGAVSGPARGAASNGPRPVVLTTERQVKRLSIVDFPTPPDVLGRIRIPKSFNQRSPQSRRDLASTLHHQGYGDAQPERPRKQSRAAAADDEELLRLRAALRAHPVHGCADREQHLRWAERTTQLERDTAKLKERIQNRTHVLSRTFTRVCAVLDDLGCLDGDTVTDPGRRLGRIHAESDLLVAECLRRKLWAGLDAPGLAAVLSTLVYEPRRLEDAPVQPPPSVIRDAVSATSALWAELTEVEERHKLSTLRRPDAGFAWAAHRWASGATLGSVLDGAELTAGDFVRWTRQLIDLLSQVADHGGAGEVAHDAVRALRRGVVASGPSAAV